MTTPKIERLPPAEERAKTSGAEFARHQGQLNEIDGFFPRDSPAWDELPEADRPSRELALRRYRLANAFERMLHAERAALSERENFNTLVCAYLGREDEPDV